MLYTAALWRGALPAVQSKRIADEAILSDLYRGLVARGPADSAIKRIADEAILFCLCITAHKKRTVSTGNGPNQLGYKDSNLEMLESESSALPFGDSPSQALIILDGF